MFGTNEIAGQKFFKDAPLNSLFVTSIFGPTIQGEGPFAGRVAIFLRLAKCNLACSFCDTNFEAGEWLTFDEIRERIAALIAATPLQPPTISMVLVITGGEPTLQPNITGFAMQEVTRWDELQIESNGLIERTWPFGVTLVVSPKVAEKDGALGRYLKPPQAVLDRADALKFVIDADDSSPYYSVPSWAITWNGDPLAWGARKGSRIYLSPMNHYQPETKIAFVRDIKAFAEDQGNNPVSFWDPAILDRSRNQANHEYAAELCLRFNFRLSLQTHLYASLP
jgi:organic radical activating enzyme